MDSVAVVELDRQPTGPLVDEAAAFCREARHGHYSQSPAMYTGAGNPGRVMLVASRKDGKIAACSVARLVTAPVFPFRKAVASRGPVLDDLADLESHLRELAAALRGRADWLAVDPYVIGADRDAAQGVLARAGFRPLAQLQDEYTRTSLVDVRRTDDELLAGVSEGHRRNLRKAESCGLEVTANAAPSDELEALLAGFARARGLVAGGGRLEALCRAMRAGVLAGQVFSSRVEGRLAAAIVVIRCGPAAIFAVGGSNPAHADTPVPLAHRLHYEAMRWAREAGCGHYDLGGLWADDPRGVAGIDRFKRGFGGRSVPVGVAGARAISPVRGRLLEAVEARRGGADARPALASQAAAGGERA